MDSGCDTDAVARADEQSGLLRRRAARELLNDNALDWPNIAEEIESAGKSGRSAVRSHLATVPEHLNKLAASPALGPRNGWNAPELRARGRIKRALRDSPSLRLEVAAMISEETQDVAAEVAGTPAIYGEEPLVAIDGLAFTEDQVLGDWFPGESR